MVINQPAQKCYFMLGNEIISLNATASKSSDDIISVIFKQDKEKRLFSGIEMNKIYEAKIFNDTETIFAGIVTVSDMKLSVLHGNGPHILATRIFLDTSRKEG